MLPEKEKPLIVRHNASDRHFLFPIARYTWAKLYMIMIYLCSLRLLLHLLFM